MTVYVVVEVMGFGTDELDPSLNAAALFDPRLIMVPPPVRRPGPDSSFATDLPWVAPLSLP